MPEAAPPSQGLDGRRGRPCLTLLAGLLFFIVQGCAGTGELTRARAGELIGADRAFSAPVSLALKQEMGCNLRPLSDDETEAEAQGRAAENYYQAYPQMDALRRLGLMDVRSTVRERPSENYDVWAFDVEPFLTEKCKELALGGQEAQGVPAVILARRELIEVIGITKAGYRTVQAEYTWKESLTATGRAFAPGSPEHESLPAAFRQTLRERNQTKDFDKVRRGRAVFQPYDDGWLLLSAQQQPDLRR